MTDRDSNRHVDDHARLRAVLDTAVDGIITIDERGTIEAANPAAERLFGYASAEMVGRNVSMLMPSPYHDEHDGYLANYARTGERRIIGSGREVSGKRKDGSVFPLYLAVSELTFGSRRVFTGFVHDLTDQKKAEDHATQLGRILEDSLNEIFIFDTQSLKFVFANRGALINLGYSAEELKQLTPVDIKPEFSQRQFEDYCQPLLRGEESELQFETVHQRKDSSCYHVHIRLQLATWEERDVIVAIILDISERKRVQDELAELNAELEERVEQRTRELRDAQAQLVRNEKLAALGQLSGGIAHEIRNPLGVIKNSAYYLKMVSQQLNEDARECVDEIEREVETANRIVSELLDFTRDPQCHPDVFSLKTVVESAVRSARIPEGVDLEIGEFTHDVRLRADAGQIERVLTNLIRNAWQALSLTTGHLKISHVCKEDHVLIGVHDTGIGIPAADLARIFEPLFTTKAKGIGLGLAVSQRYARRNGGRLTVDSKLDEGTSFHLSVPLAGDES